MKRKFSQFLPLLIGSTIFFQTCIPSLNRSVLEGISALLRADSNRPTDGDFLIEFTVSGLLGTGMIVKLNSDFDSLTINSNGKFQFAKTIRTGSDFNVTIDTQPTSPPQTCVVNGGSATMGNADVSSVLINCGPEEFALSGTITGLVPSAIGLIIQNTVDGSTVDLSVIAGTYAFTTTYTAGTSYNIVVSQQPNHPLQECTIANASNVFGPADVTNVDINCVTLAYPIQVNVVGVSPVATGTLSIQNNGIQTLNITSNGTYYFPTNIATGGTYQLQITSQPTNHNCTINPISGAIATSTVAVTVNCFSVLLASSTPTSGSIVYKNQSLRLVFTSTVDVNSCTTSTGTFVDSSLPLPGSRLFTLATTNFTNDTLLVSPTAGFEWRTGFKDFVLDCKTAVGNHPLSTTFSFFYNVPATIRYVSTSGSDLTPDGSNSATPFANIKAAIDDIGTCPTFDCAVVVEDGAYESNGTGANDRIEIVSGISLYGGFTPGSNFTVRNTTAKATRIQLTTPTTDCLSSTQTSPCAPIHSGATVTGFTTIGGFRISGTTSAGINYVSGIHVQGSPALLLTDNQITGGTGTLGTAGVLSHNSPLIAVFSEILGGSCTSAACATAGLIFTGTSAYTPNIKLNSSIRGGDCSGPSCRSYGILITDAATANINMNQINGNELRGGNPGILNAGSESTGFRLASGNANGSLGGNRIFGGQAAYSYGVYISSATGMTIGSLTLGNLIQAGTASSTAASVNLSSGHSIIGNRIQLGSTNSTSDNSNYGIIVTTGGVPMDILKNSILDGTSTSTSGQATMIGISAQGLSPTSTINSNHIRMGTVNGSSTSLNTGIRLITSGDHSVRNNLVEGGSSPGRAYGIFIENTSNELQVYHNSVSSGTSAIANNTHVVNLSGSELIRFHSNIFLLNDNTGSNTCINKPDGLALNLLFNNLLHCDNLMNNAGTVYPVFCGGSGVPGIPGCGSTLGIAANFGSNINVDPKFVFSSGSLTNFYPTVNTPCAVTQTNNVILTNSITGPATRPGANTTYTMGAYEYDGTCAP